MAKATQEFLLSGISLRPELKLPIYRQLYTALREAILVGRLRSGQRLPATRELAKTFGVSRSTVLLAFDYLFAEGYIKGKIGSGTYVTEELPDQLLEVPFSKFVQLPAEHRASLLSKRGQSIAQIKVSTTATPEEIRPFQPGLPALDAFPLEMWTRIVTRQMRRMHSHLFSYHDPAGYRPLRQALATYLRTARAVRCEADQVLIVNGSQQALDLAARVLLDAGDGAWIEDPGYLGAKSALKAAGIELLPVPVDQEGLQIETGKNLPVSPRLIYITPSHQYPLGVTMSLPRRLQLLNWANECGAWIIEDDYDSEYRYASPPLSSLQGLDSYSRVIYLGTFSKVLFPALRLGYLVVPQTLVDAFVAAKSVVDRHSAIIEQVVLAHFIEDGHFGRHIRRMRLLYQERQQILIDAIKSKLDGLLRVNPADAGMHSMGWLANGFDDLEVSRRAAQQNVTAPPLSAYAINSRNLSGLVLGYAAFNENEIRHAVQQLAVALDK